MTQGDLLDTRQSLINFNLIKDDLKEFERIFHSPGKKPVWSLPTDELPYARFTCNMHPYDKLLVLLCLCAQLFPDKLRKWTDSQREGIVLTNYKLGGFISSLSAKFIPTLQTAIFLCSGENLFEAIEVRRYFLHSSPLLKMQIVLLESFMASEMVMDKTEYVPVLSEEYLEHLMYNREIRPDFGKNFPGQLVETNKTWDDIALHPIVYSQLKNIGAWLTVEKEFNSEAGLNFRKGITCLFYGPPGTGKTITAVLIGKKYNRKVFRVDLSMTIDKYIGETEKKLRLLFDRMELYPGSILLFDESDVLFGKRTQVGDSKDRWANLLTGFLLQRIESYTGMCILTTNRKFDIEPAMMRRLDAVVNFRNPDKDTLQSIWEKLLPKGFSFETDITAEMLSTSNFTGGEIENIMKWGTIGALVNNEKIISKRVLDIYSSLELSKHGLTAAKEQPVQNKK